MNYFKHVCWGVDMSVWTSLIFQALTHKSDITIREYHTPDFSRRWIMKMAFTPYLLSIYLWTKFNLRWVHPPCKQDTWWPVSCLLLGYRMLEEHCLKMMMYYYYCWWLWQWSLLGGDVCWWYGEKLREKEKITFWCILYVHLYILSTTTPAP